MSLCPDCGGALADDSASCPQCPTRLLPVGDLPALPNLRILRRLGAGGMGTVYLAEQTPLGRQVAVKIASPANAHGTGMARFLREAQALAALEHPNVVRIHSFGEVDGTAYIVMEYVAGMSLRDKLTHERPLPVAEVVRIASSIVDALAAALAHGIIHRDIKPANILLDHRGEVHVADFGLARRTDLQSDSAVDLTATGHVVGTAQYMAPEQAQGIEADARADMYALGLVMFEMLTGERPFDGPTPMAVIAKHLHEPFPAIAAKRKDVPRALDDLVMHLTRKDRNRRPSDYAEVREALARVPLDRPAPRRRILLATAGVLTVAIAIASIALKQRTTTLPAAPPAPATTSAAVEPAYGGAPITVTFADADLRDVLGKLGEVTNTNVVVDPDVRGRVSVELTDVPWDQALDVITRSHGLAAERNGNVILVSRIDTLLRRKKLMDRIHAAEKQLRGAPVTVRSTDFNGERVTLDFEATDIREACRYFSRYVGLNIVVDSNVQGVISVRLNEVPWDQALDAILLQHDLTYVVEGNVMRVVEKETYLDELEKLAELRGTPVPR